MYCQSNICHIWTDKYWTAKKMYLNRQKNCRAPQVVIKGFRTNTHSSISNISCLSLSSPSSLMVSTSSLSLATVAILLLASASFSLSSFTWESIRWGSNSLHYSTKLTGFNNLNPSTIIRMNIPRTRALNWKPEIVHAQVDRPHSRASGRQDIFIWGCCEGYWYINLGHPRVRGVPLRHWYKTP